MTSKYWKMIGELKAMKAHHACEHCIKHLGEEFAKLHENEPIPNPINKNKIKGEYNTNNIRFGQMV